MDWSTRKKIGCISIIVGFFVVIILGYVGYFLSRIEPNCFDNKQNQDERGIDCGGVCVIACPSDARNIVVLWQRPTKVVDGVYSVVAYLENLNSELATRNLEYEFRIYDENNLLIARPIVGRTFLEPNNRTAILETPIQTGERQPAYVFFTITNNPTWETVSARYSQPQLVVRERNILSPEQSPRLEARIENTTFQPLFAIDVIALVYDIDGNIMNSSKTYISEIDQRSSRQIVFTWPEPFAKPVGRIEIIPRIDLFNGVNTPFD